MPPNIESICLILCDKFNLELSTELFQAVAKISDKYIGQVIDCSNDYAVPSDMAVELENMCKLVATKKILFEVINE